MTALEQLAQQFTSAYEHSNYDGASQLLPKIKLELARNNLIIPSKEASIPDLVAARQVLETGVFVSVNRRDEAEFSRLIAQLQPFYRSELNLPPSPNKNKITALYLLVLLSKNEIAEFHTELEALVSTLDANESVESDQYLRYPVLLERWLMEGSYDKVWKAITQSSQVPSPEFAIFAETLIRTVRDEIALSAESAYTSLPIANARHVLFFDSDRDAIAFAEQQHGWSIQNGIIYFPTLQEKEAELEANLLDSDVPLSNAEKIIANSLEYAKQIETII